MVKTTYSNFLGLPPAKTDPEKADALILPLAVDLTSAWKRGSDEGPEAIISASTHIEHYDEELGLVPINLLKGIATHPFLEFSKDPSACFQEIYEVSAALLRNDRMLVSIGGEHSVTHPLVKAHKEVWEDLCVIQIDAHADLRESYKGTRHNHACPMKRIMDIGVHVTALGIRSVDESEAPMLNGPLRKTFLDCNVRGKHTDFIPEILESLPSDNVYLTIDLDGLSPAVIPAVGTPVPGGLQWYETLDLLRALCREKNVIGADVVELLPGAGLHGSDSAASRLIYKLISYSCLSDRL